MEEEQIQEESQYFKINKKYLKRFFYLILFGAVAYVFISPMYCDYTDRARASEMLVLAGTAKSAFKYAVENDIPIKDVDKTDLIGKGTYLTYSHINDKGEIFMFAESVGTFVVLKPTIKDKKIKWSCYGQPQKNLPSYCRTSL